MCRGVGLGVPGLWRGRYLGCGVGAGHSHASEFSQLLTLHTKITFCSMEFSFVDHLFLDTSIAPTAKSLYIVHVHSYDSSYFAVC